jgi:branched-subunit amino acid aminotransferase/4-amino-4-deoxychorismate lyase
MNDRTIGPVLINGKEFAPADAAVSIFDVGFQRGYGCFEAMRTYDGCVFRLNQHLDRLEHSAGNLRIVLPQREELEAWCSDVGGGGDGVLRVYVTGGLDPQHLGRGNVVIVYLEPAPVVAASVRLDLIEAPWHADGRTSELTGAKTLSYGPNLAATLGAKSRGFDDAALIGQNDVVLEGPTFSLGWIDEGVLYTPSLDTHILVSITREATLEIADRIGIPTETGRYRSERLLEADEVFVMSTVKEVLPVTAVGRVSYEPGPVTLRLRDGFKDLVAVECG